jgi:hypothetical protein
LPSVQVPAVERLHEFQKRNLAIHDAERVHIGFEERIWKQGDDVTAHDNRRSRIRLFYRCASGQRRWQVHRMHAADADNIGLKIEYLALQGLGKAFVHDSNAVTRIQ